MSIVRLLVVLSLLCSAFRLASAQSLPQAQQDWQDRRYSQALVALTELWNQPNGRTFSIEYMIGTSECRMPGLQSNGREMLMDALRFHLSTFERGATLGEIKSCSTPSGPAIQLNSEKKPVVIEVSRQAATVSGKGGYLASDNVFNEDEVPAPQFTTPEKSVAELEGRRLPGASTYAELKHKIWESIPDDQYVSTAYKNGLLVVAPGADAFTAAQLASCVSFYKQNLITEFGMQTPNYTIRIEAEPNLREVQQYALTTHGLNLPPGTQAYSVYEDLSVTASATRTGNCGTFGHELTHLLIRTNFGDAPPWLEEGLASEVATAVSPSMNFSVESVSPFRPRVMQDTILITRLGDFSLRASWRDELFKEDLDSRPSLKELIDADWDRFGAADKSDLRRSATINGMAAAFVRFLDEKGKLKSLYTALRDKRFSPSMVVLDSQQGILEKSFGMPLQEIEDQFIKWFKASYLSLDSDSNSSNFRCRVGELGSVAQVSNLQEDLQNLWNGNLLILDIQATTRTIPQLGHLINRENATSLMALADDLDLDFDQYTKAYSDYLNAIANKKSTDSVALSRKVFLDRARTVESKIFAFVDLWHELGFEIQLRWPKLYASLQSSFLDAGQNPATLDTDLIHLDRLIRCLDFSEIKKRADQLRQITDSHKTLVDFQSSLSTLAN